MAAPAQPTGPILEPTPRLGDLRRDFPYRDRQLLRPGQRRGGRLWVPAAARRSSQPLPVLVMLHGLNLGADLHKLVSDEDYDVTRVIAPLIAKGLTRPMVVAAPTQTARAWNGRWMWTGFDLGDFLDAVQRYLPPGMRIDRDQVIVAAHSAAGCNPAGGLFYIVEEYRGPLTVVGSVDTCMTPGLGRTVRRHLRNDVPFVAVWQRGWPRRVAAFERSLGLRPDEPASALELVAPALTGKLRRISRAEKRLCAELKTDENSRWGNHLDAISHFVEMVLPRYWPGHASPTARRGRAGGSPPPGPTSAAAR